MDKIPLNPIIDAIDDEFKIKVNRKRRMPDCNEKCPHYGNVEVCIKCEIRNQS